MIKPNPHIIKAVAMAVRQYPEILEWLNGVSAAELQRLPWAVANPAIFQGRCQMIHELVEFAEQTPDLAAKL